MLIKNVHIHGRGNEYEDLAIHQDKFTYSSTETIVLDMKGALAFPGLINSHDHLEFSLFPRTGNRIYDDYISWGNDIHACNEDAINRVKNVPYELRFKWGLYKNLLCGVTTVMHHGSGKIFQSPGKQGDVGSWKDALFWKQHSELFNQIVLTGARATFQKRSVLSQTRRGPDSWSC